MTSQAWELKARVVERMYKSGKMFSLDLMDQEGSVILCYFYNEAFGLASTLRSVPMTKDTIFNMASMTKPVTSVAIMMLVDEGKLKLDDEVATYFNQSFEGF